MNKVYDYEVTLSDRTAPGAILRRIRKGSRVLEIGCSTGSQTRVMAGELACRVTAVEIDPRAAECARPYCNRLLIGSIEEMDDAQLADGAPYDAITFSDVLEHLRDPAAVLRKVRPLLDSGGVLLASIPNVTHAAVVFELLNGRFEYREFGLLDNTHIRFFDRRGVLRLFEETGFFISEIDRVVISAEDTEFRVRCRDRYDRMVMNYIRANNPDHDTFQFIVSAYPCTDSQQARDALEAAVRQIQALKQELGETQHLLRKRESELAWVESGKLQRLFKRFGLG